MLHGGGQNRHAWTNTATSLSDHGNTVVTIDTRGHGDSEWDPSGNYETDDLTHDLLAIHTQMSRGRPVVAVGASMGGMTILNAHRHAHQTCGPASCSSTSPHAWRSPAPNASWHSWPPTQTASPDSKKPPTSLRPTTRTAHGQPTSTASSKCCANATTADTSGAGTPPHHLQNRRNDPTP
ncbi:MAG: alpha/beta fold hydrolase [Ilumatobacter sp.]|uniref:alpha/beta fold hydrolase n=1 Tax=Ilumatobacter sp. TaxID=1967498 RepID=UPI00391D5C05